MYTRLDQTGPDQRFFSFPTCVRLAFFQEYDNGMTRCVRFTLSIVVFIFQVGFSACCRQIIPTHVSNKSQSILFNVFALICPSS